MDSLNRSNQFVRAAGNRQATTAAGLKHVRKAKLAWFRMEKERPRRNFERRNPLNESNAPGPVRGSVDQQDVGALCAHRRDDAPVADRPRN